jgi:hypothetical protein
MEGGEEVELNPMADPEERKHLLSVLDSFRYVPVHVPLVVNYGH